MPRFIKDLWEKEFIRFLFVSGVNTVVGYLITVFFGELIGLSDPIPTVLNYLLNFPLAYTLHTKITFREKWEIKRMFAYALTAVPNLILQAAFALIFKDLIPNGYIRHAVANILPLPIMFIIIRFIVRPLKKKYDKSK